MVQVGLIQPLKEKKKKKQWLKNSNTVKASDFVLPCEHVHFQSYLFQELGNWWRCYVILVAMVCGENHGNLFCALNSSLSVCMCVLKVLKGFKRFSSPEVV